MGCVDHETRPEEEYINSLVGAVVVLHAHRLRRGRDGGDTILRLCNVLDVAGALVIF